MYVHTYICICVLAVECMPSLYPVRTYLSSLSLVLWELTIWSSPWETPIHFLLAMLLQTTKQRPFPVCGVGKGEVGGEGDF